jgi:hypothetical protein
MPRSRAEPAKICGRKLKDLGFIVLILHPLAISPQVLTAPVFLFEQSLLGRPHLGKNHFHTTFSLQSHFAALGKTSFAAGGHHLLTSDPLLDKAPLPRQLGS